MSKPDKSYVKFLQNQFADYQPHFLTQLGRYGYIKYKIFLPQTVTRYRDRAIRDVTFQVAKACCLRLSADHNWIIRTDSNTINCRISDLVGRTISMNLIY